jgi:hypothetical protein
LPTWERRRLGGTEVVKEVSEANRAHFVQNVQNSRREPARTPALPGKGFWLFSNRWIASEAPIHMKAKQGRQEFN